MLRLKVWLILLFYLISYSVSATNYFVSSSAGNDASDGKTASTAWKTIAKVNSKTFSTGDSVFFKRGDVWRELLTVTTSGTSASYMYYGGFGTGANPKMLGSTVATSWIDQGSNVWKSANTFTNPASVGDYGTDIFFENTDGTVSWGVNSTTLSSVYNWYWSSNYIYVYSTQDPATKFKSVEIPQRASIIGLNDKNYIHINGIDLYYCGMSAVTYKTYPMIKLNGLIIENCKIAYVSTKNSEAGYGIDATYCDMIVRHCEIHDCGRRSISHHLYGNYTATNILIEDNYFHDGWHTTGPDFSVGGSGTTGSIDGVIVRRNKFYDPPSTSAFSEHMFIQNYLYSSLQSQVKNIYIYSNIFISPSANAINMEGTQSVFIYNNVFYNHNTSGNACHVWVDNNNSSVKVKNNIFYTTSTNDIGGSELFMRSGQTLANVDANYNLYYRVNNSLRIVEKEGTGSFTMNQIAQIRSQLGLEKNSPVPANPMFLSTTDYHVQSGSPAIAAGLALDVVVSDFEGNVFSNPPNIGCYATPSGSTDLTYISSSVENATPSILGISFSSTLANTAPAPSAFSVMVNGAAGTVSSVAISGANVQLTLSTPVVYNDVITVAYTKPASNPLQTSSGTQAASFTAKSVTNNVNQVVIPVPVYVSSVIPNSTPLVMEITYSLALNNTIVPAAAAFSVKVNTVTRNVSSVVISGTKVSLTLSSAIAYGDAVTIAYTQPATNPLQTPAGGKAATFTAKSVVNNVGAPVPVYVSSVVEDADPLTLAMTYSLALANIVPAVSSFAVRVNSTAVAVSSVSISSTSVLLTLATPIQYGDIITVSYTQPGTNQLQTPAGALAANLSAQTVTNNVAPAVPVYVSSSIENAAPTVLTLTYDLSLISTAPAASAFSVMVNSVARTVTSVAVSGTNVTLILSSAVEYGDLVTVSYTQPATNPLQTSIGGKAETIAPQAVDNNVLEIPVYVSSSVENAAPTVLVIVYDVALANTIPAPSSFAVLVNSSPRTVSSVSISGTTVQLTLSSAVIITDVLTVAYTPPGTNPVQTPSGGMAAAFTAQPVINNVGAINPLYVSSLIANATPSVLTMTYSLVLDNTSVPDPSAFTVMVNSVAVAVSSVAITGTNVSLTLSSPVSNGNVVTVAYTKPAASPLQTSTGGIADTMGAKPVTNSVIAVPVYLSSSIENSATSNLVMIYSLTLRSSRVPSPSAFSVMVNSVARTVSSVSVSGTRVTLRLSSAVKYADAVTVSYTQPVNNALQITSGGKAASISDEVVTNNVFAVPIYLSSLVANNTPSALEMTYGLPLNSSIVPAVTAFSVRVNNLARSVSSVTISGAKVTLNLSSPIVYGDAITVTYTQPGTNPLQTVIGGKAVSITAQPVTNNVADVPDYLSSVIENSSPSFLTVTFSMALTNAIPAPATSSFSVLVNGSARTVSSLVVSGNLVYLILTSPAIAGDVVTVAYTQPGTNPLQTTAGGKAVSFSAQSVTNNVAPLPVYVSSAVENATPTVITLTYSLSLSGSFVPVASAFTVTVNSVSRSVSSVSVSGTKVLLTIASPLLNADVVTVAYTVPASNPLQTALGGVAATITAQPVTNNVAPLPVYVSSAVQNATPSIITMTYSLALSGSFVPAAAAFTVTVNSVSRSVSSVSISGTNVLLTLAIPITNGDGVTVAYTTPGTNPLQTALGGLAATITAQSVTNNVLPGPPAYVSSVIENAAPSVVVMTYNTTLESTIIPAITAFKVTVNTFTRVVVSVSISGTKVLLTLISPVSTGDVVTVSYTKPASNPLQTPAAVQAASLSAQPVTNHVTPVIPVYVSSVIEDATPSLLAMTYTNTLVSLAPATSAFLVTVNSVTRSVTSVAITGFRVLLTLSAPVVYNDVVKISYTKPSLNPLQTASGGQAVTINNQTVINNVKPTIPGYINSVIENAAPDLLIMAYDLSLANSVPAASAFSVTVNSIQRNVTLVAIVNGEVQLTLESAIVNGDVVTVSYSKPAVNPLKSDSGAEAVSLSAQPVINNVGQVNIPPVVVINYEESVFSGFIGGLDASGSYDPNNDNLTYSWTVPSTVPVSSTSSSRIRFLAPILTTSDTVEFTLDVSDGQSVQSKSVKVIIQPYRPELGALPVMKMETDGYLGSDNPANVLDGNQDTWWSSEGAEHWLITSLTNPDQITYILLSFPKSPVNSYSFDIYASKDDISWDPVLLNAVSCMFSGDAQIFEFPLASRDSTYSFVKLLVHGNSGSDVNYISEFRVFGIQEVVSVIPGINMTLFPNPANNYFRLLLSEEPPIPYHIKIINMNGMAVYEKIIESAETYISLPVSLRSGAYIVELYSGNIILGVNRLIINELRTPH